MPVRFTSPSLGGQGASAYLERGHWQLSVNYRRLTADQWFVGRDVREDAAPFQQPLFLNIQSFDVTVARAVTDRLTLQLTLPFSRGTHSRLYADLERHVVEAHGLGDVNLIASTWLLSPASHPDGNLAIGAGVKARTGRNDAADHYYLADGSSTPFPVDQSIQLGDGGWGAIFESHGFQKLWFGAVGYVSGSYLLSPARLTRVTAGPTSSVRLAVPDVYTVSAGVVRAVPFVPSIQLSLGIRFDGIPMRDLIADDPSGFRRPARIAYVDPGLSVSRGRNTFTFSVPVRTYLDFPPSLSDIQLKKNGGGDLSKYLLFAGYTRQF